MEDAGISVHPRFEEVSWRVETKASGASFVRVDLNVDSRTESFEMSLGVLEAMLEGFGKIKDQLSKI